MNQKLIDQIDQIAKVIDRNYLEVIYRESDETCVVLKIKDTEHFKSQLKPDMINENQFGDSVEVEFIKSKDCYDFTRFNDIYYAGVRINLYIESHSVETMEPFFIDFTDEQEEILFDAAEGYFSFYEADFMDQFRDP